MALMPAFSNGTKQGSLLERLNTDPAVTGARAAARASAERATLAARQRAEREHARTRTTAELRALRHELSEIEIDGVVSGMRDTKKIAELRDKIATAAAIVDGSIDTAAIARRADELGRAASEAQSEADRVAARVARDLRRPRLEAWRVALAKVAEEIDSYCNAETAFDRHLAADVPPIHAAIATAIECVNQALGDRTAKVPPLVNRREQSQLQLMYAEIRERERKEREDADGRRKAMRKGVFR